MADGSVDLSTIDPSQVQILPSASGGGIDLTKIDPSTVQQAGPTPLPAPVADAPVDLSNIDPSQVTLTTPFKAVARGVGEGTGAAISGVGTLFAGDAAKTKALYDQIDAGQPLTGWAALNSDAAQYAAANPQRRAEMRSQISGEGTSLQSAGQSVTAATQAAIPLTPGEQQSYWTKVPETLGYAAPAVAGMMLTKGAGTLPMMGTGVAIMGAQGADQGFKDAVAHGASVDDAYTAAYGSAAIQGGLGVLPVGHVLDRVNALTGGAISRMLVGAATQAGTQGVISSVQQFLMNLQAKGLYDPQRGLGDNVTDSALMGVLAGGATGGVLGALPKGEAAPSVRPPTAETAGTPPPEGPAPTDISRTPGAIPPAPGEPAVASPVAVQRLIGQPVGLRNANGTPDLVMPEAIQDGVVQYRMEDGSVRHAVISDFQRDLTAPPAPTVRPDNAVTVPAPPEHFNPTGEPPPSGADDLNDFNPWAETPSPPRATVAAPAQSSLAIPDTAPADTLIRQAASIEAEIAKSKAGLPGAVARTPEQIETMHRMSQQLQDQASQMLVNVRPANTGAPGEIAEPTPLGALSVSTRGVPTEATTGANLTEPGSPAKRGTMPPAPLMHADVPTSEATTGINLTEPGSPAKRGPLAPEAASAPLLQAEPEVSEAQRPLPVPETDTGKLLPLSRTIGPENEAAAPPQSTTRVTGDIPPEQARATEQSVNEAGRPAEQPATQEPTLAPQGTLRVRAIANDPKTESLLPFLASIGGIRDEGGELASLGLQNKFVPGRGRLVRVTGKPLDYAREAAQETGFTGPQGRGLNTTSDLLDAMDAEARGQRQYRHGVGQRQASREYDDEQRRQIEAQNNLQRLGETPVGYGIEDLETQLGERLAMMGAASVDDAVRMFEEEDTRLLATAPEDAKVALDEVSNADDWASAEADRLAADRGAAEGTTPTAPVAQGGAEAGPVGERQGLAPPGSEGSNPAERGAAQSAVTTELTGQGEQAVIPGAERSAQQAQEAQPERLRAGVAQQEPGGMFGDEHKQTDLTNFWKDNQGTALFGRLIRGRRDGPDTTDSVAREAARLARDPKSDTQNSLNPANAFMTMPAALASRDAPSARYFNALLDQHRTAETMENEAIPKVVPYLALDPKAQARVDKVMEYARLYGQDLAPNGRRVVIQAPRTRPSDGSPMPRLTRPGETVVLDDKETAAFHSLRDFFQTRLHAMGEAIARETGYAGAFDEQSIRNAMGSNEASPRERAAAQRASIIWQQTVGAGRKGYVPFARYGQKFIKIMPKVEETPGRDAMPPDIRDGHFEFVPVSALDRAATGAENLTRGRNDKLIPKVVRDRMAELRKQFPTDKFDMTTGDVSDLKTQTDTLNIPALERVISHMNQGDEAAKAVDAVLNHVFEQRKAGFRKQAQNVPGYSTDFPRAIVDYVRHSSAVIARLQHRADVDSAYDGTQAHRSKGIAQYWKDHKAYMESNGGDFGPLRKVAFYQYLWGSPSSAVINLTQTGMITAPQLAAWTGPRAASLIGDAFTEASSAIKVGPHGLYLDWSKVGRTPAERAMVDQMVKEGTLNPVLAREFEGTSQMQSKNLRPYSKVLSRIWEIGASGFNAAEQINRATAALSYYRAANNPALLQRLIKMHADDTRFTDMAARQNPDGTRNMTPEKAAQWGVDETQFIGGKVNRAPMQRGPGGLALQMRNYQLNTLRLMYKSMTRLGYPGKMAAALMGGALVGVSGMYGLPFAEDIDNAATAVHKWWNGIDPMAEMRIRQFINDEAMSVFGANTKTAQWLAEAGTRGALRPTGADLGPRVGMGNVVPDGTIWSTVPLLSATVERAQQFWDAVKNGEPMAAAAQAAYVLGGRPAGDIASAAALPSEGKRTAAGDVVVPPSKVTATEMAEKAAGVNPTTFARATERRYQENRLAASTQNAASNLLRSAAAHFALAQDAQGSGNVPQYRSEMATFNRIIAENASRLSDPDIPAWQQVPTPSRLAMRSAIERQMEYDQSVAQRAGRMKRPQMGVVQELFGQ